MSKDNKAHIFLGGISIGEKCITRNGLFYVLQNYNQKSLKQKTPSLLPVSICGHHCEFPANVLLNTLELRKRKISDNFSFKPPESQKKDSQTTSEDEFDWVNIPYNDLKNNR